MGEVRLSQLAQRDLLEIWFHIAADKGPHTADHWIDRIEARCRQLAEFPESCASSMPRAIWANWTYRASESVALRSVSEWRQLLGKPIRKLFFA